VRNELATIADDLAALGQPVVAGFSTHFHWDHVLWHPRFGDLPRYGTAASATALRDFFASPDWRDELAGGLPPEHADDIPMDRLGLLTALPDGATEVPWDGPRIRIIEHRAHAPGHASLLIEEPGVLVSGDMLSDTLMPFLDLAAPDPIGDYLAALARFESLGDAVGVVIPGHGSRGGSKEEFRRRIAQDRAYVENLRDGFAVNDARVGPSAPLDWLPDVHEWQVRHLTGRGLIPRTSPTDVVLSFMRAFHDQDREAAETLMADDFVFTSPQDDRIDRATWLERCFPTADHFDSPGTTLQIVEVDGVVLHRYEYTVDGRTYRNTEASRVREGQVFDVEVYFGGAVS
jgi:glyoxylase-like metal-dependent hydrolase (beta-lactamase superfamily II)